MLKAPRTRRQTLALLTGAAAGLALHACKPSETGSSSTASPSSGAPSAGKTAATIGIVTWVGYTPLWIAAKKGFFQENGLDLSIKTFGTNPEGLAAFRANKIDAWTSVPSENVLLSANNKDYRVVMVADQSNGADGILASNAIADIKAFKGKSIAVEEGAISHFFLLQVLKEAGLTGADIKIVNTSPDAAAAAYQAGKVDIAVTYAPFLEKAAAARKDGRIIYDSSKLLGAIIDLYIFDTAYIQKNPLAIEAFVKGIAKGIEFLKTNPPEAYAIATKELGISAEELEASLKKVKLVDPATNAEILGNPQSQVYLLKNLEALALFLKEQKQIQQIPDLSKTLEPKFVKALA